MLQSLIAADTLQTRVAELGAAISKDLAGCRPALIVVLRGAWVFAADLVRTLTIDHTVNFLGTASYRGNKSTGQVLITQNLEGNFHRRHVLIVEDIVDTGLTLGKIIELLCSHVPASVRTVTLLDKPRGRIAQVELDYVGFEIGNQFVVGYGLDLDGMYRGLPYIATVDDCLPANAAVGRVEKPTCSVDLIREE